MIVIVRQLSHHQHNQRPQHPVQNVQRSDAVLVRHLAEIAAFQAQHLRPEVRIALDVLARHIRCIPDDRVKAHQQLLEALREDALATPRILAEEQMDGVMVAGERIVHGEHLDLDVSWIEIVALTSL